MQADAAERLGATLVCYNERTQAMVHGGKFCHFYLGLDAA